MGKPLLGPNGRPLLGPNGKPATDMSCCCGGCNPRLGTNGTYYEFAGATFGTSVAWSTSFFVSDGYLQVDFYLNFKKSNNSGSVRYRWTTFYNRYQFYYKDTQTYDLPITFDTLLNGATWRYLGPSANGAWTQADTDIVEAMWSPSTYSPAFSFGFTRDATLTSLSIGSRPTTDSQWNAWYENVPGINLSFAGRYGGTVWFFGGAGAWAARGQITINFNGPNTLTSVNCTGAFSHALGYGVSSSSFGGGYIPSFFQTYGLNSLVVPPEYLEADFVLTDEGFAWAAQMAPQTIVKNYPAGTYMANAWSFGIDGSYTPGDTFTFGFPWNTSYIHEGFFFNSWPAYILVEGFSAAEGMRIIQSGTYDNVRGVDVISGTAGCFYNKPYYRSMSIAHPSMSISPNGPSVGLYAGTNQRLTQDWNPSLTVIW